MRQPSLHITEHNLKVILIQSSLCLNQDTAAKIASELLLLGRMIPQTNRSIIPNNKKVENKVNKVTLSGKSNTALFSQILLLERRRLKHRGISIVKVGDRDWLTIKTICKLATDFAKEFNLPLKMAYSKYIQIGMSKMNNYGINKFNALHASICSTFESILELEEDSSPQLTEQAYIEYNAIINERVGSYFENYKNNPDKYVCFKRAKDDCIKVGGDVKDYIKSQFAAFDYKSGIPDPHQIYGDRAVERFKKYCFEKKIVLGKPKRAIVNLKQIRRS